MISFLIIYELSIINTIALHIAANVGNIEILKYLIDNCGFGKTKSLFNLKDVFGNSIFHLAR
jgi:hypothetical protein